MPESNERVPYADLTDSQKKERIAKMRNSADKMKGKASKGDYYAWGQTIDDIKHAQGAKETSVAGAKWLGKSVFNIGKFATAEVLPAVMKKVAEKNEENLKNK